MFGKRGTFGGGSPAPAGFKPTPAPAAAPPVAPAAASAAPVAAPAPAPEPKRVVVEPKVAAKSEEYYATKSMIFGAMIEAIDLAQLSRLDAESAREELRDIITEIISLKNVVMSIAEQEELLEDICNDVLGYGPLEPLLARDDIADIMVNGASRTFIETSGKIQLTSVRFRDNAQLMHT